MEQIKQNHDWGEVAGPGWVNSSVAWQSLGKMILSREVLPECDNDAEEN